MGGRSVSRLKAPAPEPGKAITIVLPTGKLTRGQNEIRIYDADSPQLAPVATFAFDFQFL